MVFEIYSPYFKGLTTYGKLDSIIVPRLRLDSLVLEYERI